MGAKSSGWRELAADLGAAAERVIEDGKKIVGKGCGNIKKDAQRIIRANSPHGYLPHYPRALGYEVTARGSDITGEVGSNPAKLQGGLGDIIEYGTVNNAPIPHTNPALDAELPRFERYAAEFGEQLLAGEPVTGPVTDSG